MPDLGGQLVISLGMIIDRAGESLGDLDVRLSPSDWREVTGLPIGWRAHPDAFFETVMAGHRVHFFADGAMEDGQVEIQGAVACV